MSIVYKITNRELYSCVMRNDPPGIKYKVGGVTKPKFGKLFAFNTYELARRWGMGFDRHRIWKCEAHVFCRKPIVMMDWQSPAYAMEDFWSQPAKVRKKVNPNYGGGEDEVPEGTVYCDWIKLIEEVDKCA